MVFFSWKKPWPIVFFIFIDITGICLKRCFCVRVRRSCACRRKFAQLWSERIVFGQRTDNHFAFNTHNTAQANLAAITKWPFCLRSFTLCEPQFIQHGIRWIRFFVDMQQKWSRFRRQTVLETNEYYYIYISASKKNDPKTNITLAHFSWHKLGKLYTFQVSALLLYIYWHIRLLRDVQLI